MGQHPYDAPARSGEEALLRIHRRLSTGDCTAAGELSEHVLRVVFRRLCRTFPSAAQDMVNDAVEDALLDYIGAPSRFDESRGVSLDDYLYLAGRRNLANLLRADRRRLAREERYAAQQAAMDHGPVHLPGLPPRIRAHLLQSAMNDAERSAVALFLDGEGGTELLADALRVGDLPVVERRREVKRFKDRVLKRLVRLVDGATSGASNAGAPRSRRRTGACVVRAR